MPDDRTRLAGLEKSRRLLQPMLDETGGWDVVPQDEVDAFINQGTGGGTPNVSFAHDVSGEKRDEGGKWAGTSGKEVGDKINHYTHLEGIDMSEIIKRRGELERNIKQLRETAFTDKGEPAPGLTAQTAYHNFHSLIKELRKVEAVFYKKSAAYNKSQGDEQSAKQAMKEFKRLDKIVQSESAALSTDFKEDEHPRDPVEKFTGKGKAGST